MIDIDCKSQIMGLAAQQSVLSDAEFVRTMRRDIDKWRSDFDRDLGALSSVSRSVER